MTDKKKKRMSMLDSLAASGMPSAESSGAAGASGLASMMSSNRALRSARDAVDAHQVWDLDPSAIDDDRVADRLDAADVADLVDAIEANGQTVPILVRRDPNDPDRYKLVYGRRRLEAIRQSDKVKSVRALVANMDDDSALRAQISENMARRDLSYIEKAVFSQGLIDIGFGTQSQIAEVLTVSKSSISMALAIVNTVGLDLVLAIGPAHGIGRPRWDALGRAIAETGASRDRLIEVAEEATAWVAVNMHNASASPSPQPDDPSVLVFEAVEKAVGATPGSGATAARPKPQKSTTRGLLISGQKQASLRRTPKGVVLSLDDGPFADWFEAEAQNLMNDLHLRWLQRGDD